MNKKRENLFLFAMNLTLVVFLFTAIAVFVSVSVDNYKDIMEIKSHSGTKPTESASCLGEDIYDINGRKLLINNDMLYNIETRFLWYYSNKIGNYKVYDSSELTTEVLKHRAGKGITVVERCIGYVTDGKTGDGMVINAGDTGVYITYNNINQRFKTGTVFVTYMVYADNNYIDDFERYDFILTRDYEVSK